MKPAQLDAILFDRFRELSAARASEDRRIADFIGRLNDGMLAADFSYRTIVHPKTISQPLHFALDHFFNHQTHHRGQAHALLTCALGNDGAPSLDLILLQREKGLGGVRSS